MHRLITALIFLGTIATGCILVTEDDSFDDESSTEGTPAPPPSPTPGLDGGSGDAGCNVGSEGCACTTGGKCNDPFLCNQNLNICVADVCPVGTETCACTPEGSCDPGLSCASDLCVDLGCAAGTEGCSCTEGGGCDPGLACLSDLCVDPESGASGTD